jgi:hypothetical protein
MWQLAKHVVDPGRERRVIHQRRRTGVGEQVVQFVLDVSVVHIERGGPGPPGAEHPLDVLGSVVRIDAKQVLADLVTAKRRPLGLGAKATGMQVRRKPVSPLHNLGVRVAAGALNDEVPVADHARHSVGGGRDRELGCRVGHLASQGWWGSSLSIRPLASDSTLPSASVIAALMKAFRPSRESIHARDTKGWSVGVILR